MSFPPRALLSIAASILTLGLAAAEIQPTIIESTTLEMKSTDTETTAIFERNVVVTGNNLKISCDYLEVLASRLGNLTDTVAKLDQFKSLIAVGRVHIIQGDREVTCGRAEVFPREEKIVLTENPVVIDKSGPYVASGTKIVLLRGERRLFGDNIKLSGPGLLDLGFDKNAPMKAPAPIAEKAVVPAPSTATAPRTP